MMNKAIVTVVVLTLSIAINVFSQDSIVPVEVARTPTFSEAPVVDAKGNVYISEPYRGVITRITLEGETSVWAELAGANGHRILSDGTHLVCADSHEPGSRKVVWRFDSDGEVIGEAASTCEGKPLRHPNDIVLDSYGGFYFTDPGDFVMKDKVLTFPESRICYVDSTGQSHLVREYDDGMPNGIALRADGKVLYVADSVKNAILTFQVRSPGKVGPENVFARMPKGEEGKRTGIDGITFDDKGNLYVPQSGTGLIRVFNSQGELIRSLPAGQNNPSNVVFGGPERDQLYVTGCPGKQNESGILYRLDLKQD